MRVATSPRNPGRARPAGNTARSAATAKTAPRRCGCARPAPGPPWARPATPRAAPAPAPWLPPAPAAGRATGRALGGQALIQFRHAQFQRVGRQPQLGRAPQPGRALADGRGDAQAFRHRHAVEDVGVLELAAQPGAHAERRPLAPYGPAAQLDLAGRALGAVGDAAHQRGLARAAWADQSQQLAAAGLQVDAFQHLQAAEAPTPRRLNRRAFRRRRLAVSAGAVAARAVSAPAAAAAARAAAAG